MAIFVIQVISSASELMAKFWHSFLLCNASTQTEIAGEPLTESQTSWYLGIYAAFGLRV